jgi:hypothetical protein
MNDENNNVPLGAVAVAVVRTNERAVVAVLAGFAAVACLAVGVQKTRMHKEPAPRLLV